MSSAPPRTRTSRSPRCETGSVGSSGGGRAACSNGSGINGSAWIWLTRETAFPTGPAALLAARPLPSPELRLAVGCEASGLSGFRRSHLAAVDAMRVGRRAGPSGRPEGCATPVVDYRTVSLLALLSQDPERAAWFRTEELGPLGGRGADLEDLRRTVLGYLETRSHAATAARLFLHRNTVRHRVQRAEQLLGHPLTERAEEVWAALRLLENRRAP